jgi:hypothetical protein
MDFFGGCGMQDIDGPNSSWRTTNYLVSTYEVHASAFDLVTGESYSTEYLSRIRERSNRAAPTKSLGGTCPITSY